MVELSEGMFVLGLKAAAEGLPFLPTWSGLGSDILTVNTYIKTVQCPYTDAVLTAVPPTSADVAFLHVNAASSSGYGRIMGDAWLDRIIARAAKKTIVTTEQIVPIDELKKDHSTIKISRLWVDGVVEVPYGAHPTGCFPDYGVDRLKLDEYTRASVSLDTAEAYLDSYVRCVSDQSGYIELVGGLDRLSQIKYG
jgi:glutaconate CoA-transferase subunit A